MRPLPPILQQPGFHFSTGRLVDRPWWRVKGTDDIGTVYVRSDGASVLSDGHLTEAHDLKDPLPFPGVRVGQVWAATCYRDPEKLRFMASVVEFDPDRVSRGRRLTPWLLGSDWVGDAEIREVLSEAFLMADPVFPHLAPWAPVARSPA